MKDNGIISPHELLSTNERLSAILRVLIMQFWQIRYRSLLQTDLAIGLKKVTLSKQQLMAYTRSTMGFVTVVNTFRIKFPPKGHNLQGYHHLCQDKLEVVQLGLHCNICLLRRRVLSVILLVWLKKELGDVRSRFLDICRVGVSNLNT